MPIPGVKMTAVQIGQSNTDSQNFLLFSNNDGSGKLARGSQGTLGDIISWDANGVISTTRSLTLAASQPTTTGTLIDFTNIPTWVKRITVMCERISTNGTSSLMVQVGAGSVDVTNYAGQYTILTNSAAVAGGSLSAGFRSGVYNANTETNSGAFTLTHMGANKWMCTAQIANATYNSISTCAGVHDLAGTLDRVRITTVNGTDVFDAGSVNILYEG
jgi:hypothetical protein